MSEILITTHLTIAKSCYKACSKIMDLKLDQRAFLYGVIEPDLHKRKTKINHTYSISVGRVQEYIDRIKSEELTIKEKSFLLGNIAHYVADSFCKYHLEENYGKNMINHFCYEVLLDFKMNKAIFTKKHLVSAIIFGVEDECKDYLEEVKINRERYLTINEHCLNDLYYTIKTTGKLLSYMCK